MPVAAIAVLIALFSVYAGLLGCEAVARFSALALLFAAACILLAVTTNIPAMRVEFLLYSEPEKINVLSLVKSLDVPVLYAVLSPHTSGKKGRALLIGSLAPYVAWTVVILSCRALLGKTAFIYSSPVFALFQLAKAGSFTKLDILYICTVLVLLFCELSLAVSAVKLLKAEVKK